MIPCLKLACQRNKKVIPLSANDTHIIDTKPLNFSTTTSPEKLFEKLQHKPWAMWLDSSNGEHVDAKYDIMVWQPKATIITVGRDSFISYQDADLETTSQDDPISLLESLQNKIIEPFSVSTNNLPFKVGAVGYFAYDLGRRFETLPSQAKRDIEIPEMAVGIYTHALIFDRINHTFSLTCPENERGQLEQQLVNIVECNKQTQTNFSLTSQWQSNMTKESYQEKFNKIQDYLRSGDCYQINLTQRFSASYQGDEFSAYCSLREANKAPFSAFIRLPDCVILSISPERFIKVEQDTIQSKPIKGTLPRSEQPEQDEQNKQALANSAKDQSENLMIVDLLRNDISKVAAKGTVQVPKLFDIESFPAVHHLVSTVEAKLDSKYKSTDLLRGAFPGGSITGAPKIRAMEIIDELEPHRRSVYCGSIGYISACGNMDTSITIRTIIANKQTMYCWAGGGIVADSKVDAEYQETYDKVNKILPVLSQL